MIRRVRRQEKQSEKPAKGGGAQIREIAESESSPVLSDKPFHDDPQSNPQGSAATPIINRRHKLALVINEDTLASDAQPHTDITSSDFSSSDVKQVEEILTVSSSPRSSAIENNPSPTLSEGPRTIPLFSDLPSVPFHSPELEVAVSLIMIGV